MVYILYITNSIVVKLSFINLDIHSIPESLSLSLSLFSLVFLCVLSWYKSLNPQQWLPQNATSSYSTSNSILAIANIALPTNISLLLLSNMSLMMTIKLDYGNYIVWKHQI